MLKSTDMSHSFSSVNSAFIRVYNSMTPFFLTGSGQDVKKIDDFLYSDLHIILKPRNGEICEHFFNYCPKICLIENSVFY